MMETKVFSFTMSYDPEVLENESNNITQVLDIPSDRITEMINLPMTEMNRLFESGCKTFNSLEFALSQLNAEAFTGNEILFLIYCGLNSKVNMEKAIQHTRLEMMKDLIKSIP